MMGRIADASDFGRSLVPYLTWADEPTSRSLLHLSFLSSLLLAFLAPYIPWRLVFLLIGEGAFVLSHPVVLTFLSSILSSRKAQLVQKKNQQKLRRLMEDDGLSDKELEGEIQECVRVEMESRNLREKESGALAWEGEVVIGGELPKGCKWLGDWEESVPDDGMVDQGEQARATSVVLSLIGEDRLATETRVSGVVA